MALAALAVAAGGFMTLRAMGVGPFATLVSSGALAERDRIVLADFTNRTTDSTLGASITEAFRIDLTQSPVVRLVEGNEVVSTLRLMGRNPGLPLTREAAHDIAVRVGAKAVLVGEVTPLGSGHVLSARLMAVIFTSTAPFLVGCSGSGPSSIVRMSRNVAPPYMLLGVAFFHSLTNMSMFGSTAGSIGEGSSASSRDVRGCA